MIKLLFLFYFMLILKYFIYKYFKDIFHLSEGLANTELMCEIIVLLSLLSVIWWKCYFTSL